MKIAECYTFWHEWCPQSDLFMIIAKGEEIMAKVKPATKICKHCATEIPYKAKICPHCRKRQGGIGCLGAIVIAVVLLFIIGALGSGGTSTSTSSKPAASAKPTVSAKKETIGTESKKPDVPSDSSNQGEVKAKEESEAKTEAETEAKGKESTSSDIRKAIDSYEAFFNEYIAFMEKYKRNPSDLQLLSDYLVFVEKYEKTMNDLDALNDADMSAADREYYLDAMNRINKKRLSVMD